MLDDKVQHPPDELYHGTSVKSVLEIAEKGLLPMNRHFVHLSETFETALSVGKRHGKPIIIEINTGPLVKDGWRFYKTSDNVWLTLHIPDKYLKFSPWICTKTPGSFTIDELHKEIGDRKTHFLYHQLKDLKQVWRSSASDDCLFQNQKSGE